VGPEYTLRGLDYLLGTHPLSNVSYVSGIGTQSKLIGYGNNRADYTFIPGGMIPGVTILQPDFPELKTDWPFLWYENEYVVDAASAFILTAAAADSSRNRMAERDERGCATQTFAEAVQRAFLLKGFSLIVAVSGWTQLKW
jgi:hypothetical protein